MFPRVFQDTQKTKPMPNAIGLSDQTNILSKSTLSSIGKYSAKKSIFSQAGEKIVKKISPYFLLSEVENFPKLHFFGKNCQD